MAIQPNEKMASREFLQPGAHGETFIASLPGYRTEEDRINRTNLHLNVCDHDVPNCKWDFDPRLPVLFRYSYAYGFNQIVTPKGRAVALDKTMNMVDFETKKQHNTLTLANGGVPVRLREASDLYKVCDNATDIVSAEASGKAVLNVGKEWVPVTGMEKAYTKKAYRPFVDASAAVAEGEVAKLVTPAKQLTDAGFGIDNVTGKVINSETGAIVNTVRPGNVPIGIIERNEYTRDIDAYNGMMPGPVRTDAMIELPWFAFKDKAENNPWGSAYGNLFPGALVKSDENGRLTLSPLSLDSELATMSAAEIEFERRQVLGEVYSATQELLPEGAAKWAVWALEDRLNYEGFNPTVYRQTNRRNEDAINASPYNSTGEYPGYPYDKAFTESNLHMLGANLRNNNYNLRMEQEHQYSELGIPGLTDGYNAVVREIPAETVGTISHRGTAEDYVDQIFRCTEVDIVPGSLEVKIGDNAWVNATVGQSVANNAFVITYASEHQGLFTIHINKDSADSILEAGSVSVSVKYKKRGLAGVPTFMDWDGCIGSIKVLLQK